MTKVECENLAETNMQDYEFVLHDSKNNKIGDIMKLRLSEDILISDLKSFLLLKTENKGFYLENFVNNDETLKHLQDMKASDKNVINAY